MAPRALSSLEPGLACILTRCSATHATASHRGPRTKGLALAAQSKTSASEGPRLSSGGTESLPHLVVARDGSITVPFAGQVRVAGLTVEQASRAIAAALRGREIDPRLPLLGAHIGKTVRRNPELHERSP